MNLNSLNITAEAGRTTGSFYQHFASKEKLLEALLGDLLALGDASAGAAGHSDDFTDREAIRYHISAYWGFYRRNRALMDAFRQAAIVDASFASVVQKMLEPDRRHLADHLAKVDLPGDPLVIATAFESLISGFAATWLAPDAPALGRALPDDEAIATLTSLFYRGISG